MSTADDDGATGAPFGVYVHVPFCASKCDYCAFATWTDRDHLVDRYLAALRREIAAAIDAGMPPASSIFVGGGTPSHVPAESLAGVIAAIPAVAGAEITVECNPDDVDEALLRAYRDAGVNRVSIGVQSMVPEVLRLLGRRHDPENVARAVAAIGAVGLPTFNVDIIYGSVGERVADWSATVDAVVALAPPHVSAYGLTVEPGTPLAADQARHPDDDDQATKYELVDDRLAAAGLRSYEVSNWALDGHESRHNSIYWDQGNYRGLGCAAHSHADGHRWWNVRTPDRYVELVERDEPTEAAGERLDADERRVEGLQLALRTRSGVPLEALDGDSLDDLVTRHDGRWVLTRRGRLLANAVSMHLR